MLPYAEETIIQRAVPYVDGLKPVQRRILYAMYELGLTKGGKKKCARIVGDAMGKYHPHGDQSLYDALRLMADSYEKFNAPLVAGQGNLGKTYSNPKLPGGIAPAKMRYPEAGLTEIGKLMFDGIEDDAVDMIPNFDESEVEPVVLPTKFPNILVNANKGIAVGVGSYVPTYPLKSACLAVAAYIRGKDVNEIVSILGAPDFGYDCTIHADEALLLKLFNTGVATFTMTGTFHREGNDLVIDSVPAGVSFERVTEQLKKLAATDAKNEILDIKDNTGLGTTGIHIVCKAGISLRNLMILIAQKTDVRSTISFRSRIITDERPIELSVHQLIETWVKFRSDCIRRVYTKKTDKLEKQVHELEAWGLIKDDLDFVVETIRRSKEDDARATLAEKFGLDDVQLDYIFNLRLKTISIDKAEKETQNLIAIRAKLEDYAKIRDNDEVRCALIAAELEEIANKYGTERKCRQDELVSEEEKQKPVKVVPDTPSTVFVTRKGNIKCLHKILVGGAMDNYVEQDDELACPPVIINQNDTLLLFTYSGLCYKIPVDDIESTNSAFKQKFYDLVERKDNSPIFYACAAKDYKGSFTIVWGNGRGRKVLLEDFAGNRRVYKNAFTPSNNVFGSPERVFLVPYESFFMITKNGKAAYGTTKYIERVGLNSRIAFKVARTTASDPVVWFMDAKKVDENEVDFAIYSKDWCVKVKEPSFLKAIEENKPMR